ncbi:MAG: hypothetical protein JSV62_05355 [Promethearchaeota archaeon]|nr:MAG: hypothetical protein JSV62_05355 [Candidatus Lokiarchaeota archaeon]
MDFQSNSNNFNNTFGFKLENFNSQDCRFHAIYFIDYETGALLVSNRYTDDLNFLKDDLICSFLNAIDLFINEVNEGGNEELREINFKGTRILYEREGRLLAIAITKKTNLQMERGILREIVEDFYIRFKNLINNFNGEVNQSILNYKKRLESLDLNSLFRFDIHI